MADMLSTQAALFDFVAQWMEDIARGTAPPPLTTYLARFPGHEEAIAREYVRLAGERAQPAAGAPRRAPTVTAAGNATSEELLDRLKRPRRGGERYVEGEELARGGMGSIVRAHDDDLDRDVAMKVMLGRGSRQVARFLEEARVTGHLEHPGVVPVHELGVDERGRVFFTMRLIEGRDLREIIRLVRARAEGWTLTRALEVLLKVCDTVAYAHSRGVVHRDIKPANVRVGSFGEVYVMDWGLARAPRTPASARSLATRAPATRAAGPRTSGSRADRRCSRARATCSARRATCRPSKPKVARRTSDRPPTSTPWARCSTTSSPACRARRPRA